MRPALALSGAVYRLVIWGLMAALCLLSTGSAIAAAPDNAALDFLIQKVCVDGSGRVLQIDPYQCPPGDTLRSLRPGEPLPYHRHDQPEAQNIASLQRRDSYPFQTRDGEVVVNLFDYAPFGHFDSERDGYDITVVRDGWASISATSAKAGPTTFFGSGCRPHSGWVLFPTSALGEQSFKAGKAAVPIKGVHWASLGQTWPGSCPAAYETDSMTSWEELAQFQFGGVGEIPPKRLDTIRSIHGFVSGPRFLSQGHLEVFYFTRLYGFTRWESWAPKERFDATPNLSARVDVASARCAGPVENVYNGITFVRIACRDWTDIDVPAKAEPPPDWPVPGAR
jgi:hypothetical protein